MQKLGYLLQLSKPYCNICNIQVCCVWHSGDAVDMAWKPTPHLGMAHCSQLFPSDGFSPSCVGKPARCQPIESTLRAAQETLGAGCPWVIFGMRHARHAQHARGSSSPVHRTRVLHRTRLHLHLHLVHHLSHRRGHYGLQHF